MVPASLQLEHFIANLISQLRFNNEAKCNHCSEIIGKYCCEYLKPTSLRSFYQNVVYVTMSANRLACINVITVLAGLTLLANRKCTR